MAPMLWVVSALVGVQLQLVRAQLEPLFNALPLKLHMLQVYIALLVVGYVARWAAKATGIRPSASSLVFVAAYATLAPALANLGRWTGVIAGAQLGPERGAVAALVLLTAPLSVVIFLMFDPRLTVASGLHPALTLVLYALVFACQAMPFGVAHTVSEYLAPHAGVQRYIHTSPELHMLKLSVVFALLSVRYLDEEAKAESEHAARADINQTKETSKSGERRPPPPREPASISTFALALRALPVLTAGAAYMAYQTAPFITDELRVHSSVASVSGRVVVIDNIRASYRALRVDHSLVGGVWIDQKPGDVTGMAATLLDSVFAAMPLQEIALLAREPEQGDSLLVIGLGAGIGAEFYTRRGLSVDVVEYDEAVYNASRDYFGLGYAPPASVTIDDGAVFVAEAAERVRAGEEDPWTYIIHDVFSAGSMPVDLFTYEFWKDVDTILAPDGVVSMNFAGPINAPMTKRIIATLLDVIGHCRCFDDSFSGTSSDADAKNLVCICARSPVQFRVATKRETPSPLRQRVYGSGGQYGDGAYLLNEIKLSDMLGDDRADLIIHRGEAANVTEWDLRLANDIWSRVSALMPPHFWVAY